MTVKNFYQPTEPTDWTKKLKEVYARQTRQLEEHHANLRQRDQQMVDKAKAEDITKLFSSLASFSTSVKSAVDATKASKDKKELKKQGEARVSWIKNFTDEDRPEAERLIKWKTDEANLKVDFAEFESKVNSSEILSDAAKSSLLEKHGANTLYYQHIIGQGKLDSAVATINNGFIGDTPESQELKDEWDEIQLNGTPEEASAFVERYLTKELDSLNISDEQLVDKYLPQILTLANTKDVLNSIKIADRKLSEKNIYLQSRVDLAGKTGDSNALAKEAQMQIKALGHDDFLLNVFKAVDTGDFNGTEFEQMLEGYIEHPGGDITIKTEADQKKYPGFKIGAKIGKGKLLFSSKEHLNKINTIQNKINTYNKAQVSAFEAAETVASTNDIAYIIKGDDTIENLQKRKDERLTRLARTLGEDSDAYKTLAAIDPTVQDANSYAATRQEYSGYYNNTELGKLLQNKENFKTIPNVRVSRELGVKVAEAETYLRDNGLPTDWKSWMARAKRSIKTSDGQKNNFKSGEELSPSAEKVQLEVAQKELELHLLFKGAFKNPSKEKAEAEKKFNEWIIATGFNVKDVPGNEKFVGRLSPDIDGNYTRNEEIGDARAENNTLPQSSYYITTWNQRTDTTRKKYGNVELMLSDAESLVDKEDSLGSFVEPNDQGQFQLYYSPELIHKSLRIGKQPGYVLKKSIEALIANPEYKDYVARHDLKNKLKLLENAPDLKLKELMDKIDDKNLSSLYNYNGVLRFDSKQITRLIKLEASLNVNKSKPEE